MAEFVADVFLCPLEATRIRLVSDPTYANGLMSAFPKIAKSEGIIRGFYSGFTPILFKQIPYTMAKFAVQVGVFVGWLGYCMIDGLGGGESLVLVLFCLVLSCFGVFASPRRLCVSLGCAGGVGCLCALYWFQFVC